MAEDKSKIRSLAKAFNIIGLLADRNQDMSLADISRMTGLKKTTAHGIISTLKDFGYIEQSSANSNYRLGTRFFEIGSVVANRWDVRTIAAKYLESVASRMGETVHLSVLSRNQALCIDKFEAKRNYALVTAVGTLIPAYSTGTGKALLAYMDSDELEEYLRDVNMAKFTPNTITDPEILRKELELVRERGYAFDHCEMMNNIICIAATIFSYGGTVCAAASISFCLSDRTDEPWQDKALKTICETAQEISRELGYSGVRQL